MRQARRRSAIACRRDGGRRDAECVAGAGGRRRTAGRFERGLKRPCPSSFRASCSSASGRAWALRGGRRYGPTGMHGSGSRCRCRGSSCCGWRPESRFGLRRRSSRTTPMSCTPSPTSSTSWMRSRTILAFRSCGGCTTRVSWSTASSGRRTPISTRRRRGTRRPAAPRSRLPSSTAGSRTTIRTWRRTSGAIPARSPATASMTTATGGSTTSVAGISSTPTTRLAISPVMARTWPARSVRAATTASGVAGVNWNSSLMPVRACNVDGCATDRGCAGDLLRGWRRRAGRQCKPRWARIFSQTMQDVISVSPDTLFVVSAGNEGSTSTRRDSTIIRARSPPPT